MNLQHVRGNISTRASRRKAKNRKRGSASAHTRRFRASTGPVIEMRSLASVGGATRRAMRKGSRMNMGHLMALPAMLPPWMNSGIDRFVKLAQALQTKWRRTK